MAAPLPYATPFFLRTPSLYPPFHANHPSHSLSLSLQHFFPLAADLVCPPKPRKPYLLYTEGNSAVTVTVAECNGDFNHLLINSPRDVRELHPFVPPLPPAHVSVENKHVS
ncbi:Coumaroyl-CoA:anthocyanidin 3-O-glucoside-6''-O-coumaroyltransferase 1 [Morella rubra]|uniref:Coumaroyl-CoA:anthocyanidin 3-O-glucoside-6''-O-coumaroyltransferase 1 n=1 Tax=Morella rubra TaxID=262757 RepID=A0A6A1VBL1_9ROSI|nr:Coumaroyl-CoA:anthocyanidin 3-O-glucoside-6''-O-coumaroyltransferase 1 [Morella rubra]